MVSSEGSSIWADRRIQHNANCKEIDYSHHCGVSYPDTSLAQDIKRLHRLWRNVQIDRHRDAIYKFLTGVYELVECWRVERLVAYRAKRALIITGDAAREQLEPFGAILTAAIAPDRTAPVMRVSPDQRQVRGKGWTTRSDFLPKS
jgi:hypothetical protein